MRVNLFKSSAVEDLKSAGIRIERPARSFGEVPRGAIASVDVEEYYGANPNLNDSDDLPESLLSDRAVKIAGVWYPA